MWYRADVEVGSVAENLLTSRTIEFAQDKRSDALISQHDFAKVS